MDFQIMQNLNFAVSTTEVQVLLQDVQSKPLIALGSLPRSPSGEAVEGNMKAQIAYTVFAKARFDPVLKERTDAGLLC